jgi:hypothetical protein
MTGKTISALSAKGGQLPEDYHIPRQGRINRNAELRGGETSRLATMHCPLPLC